MKTNNSFVEISCCIMQHWNKQSRNIWKSGTRTEMSSWTLQSLTKRCMIGSNLSSPSHNPVQRFSTGGGTRKHPDATCEQLLLLLWHWWALEMETWCCPLFSSLLTHDEVADAASTNCLFLCWIMDVCPEKSQCLANCRQCSIAL